jgi:hypothetical protein
MLFVMPARGEDLFRVDVVGTSDTLSVSGSSLLDLASDAAGQEGAFEVFAGQAYTANVTYAGLEDAINISSNADNSLVTLTIPSTGFTKTFDAADGDIEDQIEDFLKEDGADALADFISVINEQTLVGVTDGNPSALTAMTSNETFRLFGDFRNPFGQYVQGGDGLRLYANGAVIDTEAGDGMLFEGALTTSFRFTNRVALVLDALGSYRNIEDSETITLTGIAGLPIRISPELDDDQPFFWQITPSVHLGGGGSADQLAGGLVLGGGVTNLVGIKAGDFLFSSGQHLGVFEGQPIDVSGYEFETDVSQAIFKGSLAVTYGGIGQHAYLQGGVVYTDFLKDAGVDNYVTPFAGLGFKLGRGVMRVGYSADLADDFTLHRGEVELRLAL